VERYVTGIKIRAPVHHRGLNLENIMNKYSRLFLVYVVYYLIRVVQRDKNKQRNEEMRM